MSILSAKITPLQCRDTTLALAFVALIVWFFTHNICWVYGCMALLLFGMIWPSGMTWPAKLWFGLSHVLGSVMSRVLLSLIYLLILMPVALVRRIMGKDTMRLRLFKAGADSKDSAFVQRDHTFTKDDLTHPY